MIKLYLILNYKYFCLEKLKSTTSCPSASSSKATNFSEFDGPTSAIETNKDLLFAYLDKSTNQFKNSRPRLSLLGLWTAKKMSQKFLSSVDKRFQSRRLSTSHKLCK